MSISPGNMSLHQLARELLRHDAFFLLLHLNPDGDSVGSSLALALALQEKGKSVQVGYDDCMPASFRYLPGSDEIRHWSELNVQGAVAVLCDCSDQSRVGGAVVLVETAPVVFNLDHHPDNLHFGHFNLVDEQVSATGEIVYRLISELGVELTREIAEALYLAIVTDSGGFRYEHTSPATHRIAAALLEAGVQPHRVAQRIYDNRTESSLRLLATALDSLTRHEALPVAWVVLTHEDLIAAGARPEDAESVVAYPRSLEGVEVAFLVREEEPHHVKVSLRSQSVVNVGELAREFGGGGHLRAAGCRLSGVTPVEATRLVLRAVERYLRRHEEA